MSTIPEPGKISHLDQQGQIKDFSTKIPTEQQKKVSKTPLDDKAVSLKERVKSLSRKLKEINPGDSAPQPLKKKYEQINSIQSALENGLNEIEQVKTDNAKLISKINYDKTEKYQATKEKWTVRVGKRSFGIGKYLADRYHKPKITKDEEAQALRVYGIIQKKSSELEKLEHTANKLMQELETYKKPEAPAPSTTPPADDSMMQKAGRGAKALGRILFGGSKKSASSKSPSAASPSAPSHRASKTMSRDVKGSPVKPQTGPHFVEHMEGFQDAYNRLVGSTSFVGVSLSADPLEGITSRQGLSSIKHDLDEFIRLKENDDPETVHILGNMSGQLQIATDFARRLAKVTPENINDPIEKRSSVKKHLSSEPPKDCFKKIVQDMHGNIEKLKVGEELIIPGGYSKTADDGHAVLYVIKRQENGKLSFTMINTGEGAKVGVEIIKGRTVAKLIEDIPDKDLSTNFLAQLLGQMVPLAKNSSEKHSMDEVDKIIKEGLVKSDGGKLNKKGGPQIPLQKHGTCAHSCVCAWIDSSLSSLKNGKVLTAEFNLHMAKSGMLILQNKRFKRTDFIKLPEGFKESRMAKMLKLVGWEITATSIHKNLTEKGKEEVARLEKELRKAKEEAAAEE